jgi:hypothetical protein
MRDSTQRLRSLKNCSPKLSADCAKAGDSALRRRCSPMPSRKPAQNTVKIALSDSHSGSSRGRSFIRTCH